jgi:predicted small lipoprotein YifL
VALTDRRIVLRATLAAVLISATALSACGRKGALEPPPGPAAVTEDGAAADAAKKGKPGKPDRTFALDFLI